LALHQALGLDPFNFIFSYQLLLWIYANKPVQFSFEVISSCKVQPSTIMKNFYSWNLSSLKEKYFVTLCPISNKERIWDCLSEMSYLQFILLGLNHWTLIVLHWYA